MSYIALKVTCSSYFLFLYQFSLPNVDEEIAAQTQNAKHRRCVS